MNKGQNHKFRKATGLRLQTSYPQKVARDMLILFYMAVHDGRGRIETHLVGHLHYLQPLHRIDTED
mgnify:CR=1 FL=1